MKLKIYVDHQYLPSGCDHVEMLYPFWGAPPLYSLHYRIADSEQSPNSGRLNRYIQKGHEIFSLAPLEEADLAVFPCDWEVGKDSPELSRLTRDADRWNKPVLIFFLGDSETEKIQGSNYLIFRYSLHRSHRNPREFALPPWSGDFVGQHLQGKPIFREKREKPVIGYCGYTRLTGGSKGSFWRMLEDYPRSAQFIHRHARKFSLTKNEFLRSVAVSALSKNKDVETNFLIRERFWDGNFDMFFKKNGESDAKIFNSMKKSRREFAENIFESDYVLCTRGGGNFSYRFFETLCSGRIPVFVDTDCVLPYDQFIDWKQYCVWVDEKDITHLPERVAEFHASLSLRDFLDLQVNCRNLWKDWLSPEGFFSNLYRYGFVCKDESAKSI